MINFCISAHLLKSDENKIWSEAYNRNQKERMRRTKIRSSAGKQGAYKKWQPDGKHDGKPIANDEQNDSIKGKELKEKKGKEIIKSADAPLNKFKPPSLEEVRLFFIEKKSTELEAEKFYNFYESNGWRVGKNKMQKWKASVANWVFNNRSPEKGKSGIGKLAL